MKYSTRKNTRRNKYNYYSKETWRKKTMKLADELNKYMDIGYEMTHFNKLINFDKLDEAVKHLKELDQLLSLPD